jgi:hypothetical protein
VPGTLLHSQGSAADMAWEARTSASVIMAISL